MDLQFGHYQLKRTERQVIGAQGPVDLSARSFEILALLLARPDEVIGKTEIFEAVWPGLVVEENTLQVHISALRKALDADMIMTVHGRGYKYAGPRPVAVPAGPAPGEPSGLTASETPMPSKPSIAVLAFQNMSGDVEQEYFADGVADDIITALSRTSGLFVIARNSSFTYKGRNVDVKQIGRELGVRYVLEGSIRRAGGRIRIAAQLINSATGEHLWVERYDGASEDVFDLQDQVASSVVGAIAPRLEQAEIARAMRKPTSNLDAYDHYRRGLAVFWAVSFESSRNALTHFYRAIELDPDYAEAHGYAAMCFVWRKILSSTPLTTQEVNEAQRLATRAVELGPTNDIALALAGNTLSYVLGDIRSGTDLTQRALDLNPNSAHGWVIESWNKHWNGEFDAAIESCRRAMRLSPQDPVMFHMQETTADCHFAAGRYEDALSWAAKALSGKPKSISALLTTVASLAMLDRQAEAEKLAQQYMQVDPAFQLCLLPNQLPYVHPEHLAHWLGALRKAGLPD